MLGTVLVDTSGAVVVVLGWVVDVVVVDVVVVDDVVVDVWVVDDVVASVVVGSFQHSKLSTLATAYSPGGHSRSSMWSLRSSVLQDEAIAPRARTKGIAMVNVFFMSGSCPLLSSLRRFSTNAAR